MYTEHYGFAAPPFQLTPDARFWYDSRTHKKAMAYLGYGLAQGEGFITITGEIGAGKTTLVGHLLARIDRTRLNAVQLVSTQVEGDDVLRLVAIGLGIDADGTAKALLLDRVEQQLETDYRGGKRTLIIVDEAQNLPVSALEELRMLSNFQLEGRALVQIILLAQPEFRDQIAGPGAEQLRQRVIATHHLDAMEDDEIEAYVTHRLGLVGWTGAPAFDADLWAALHHYTGGIPRRLNQFLNRLLLHSAIEDLQRVGPAAAAAVADDLGVTSAAPEPAASAQLTLSDKPAVEPAPAASAKRATTPVDAPQPIVREVVTEPRREDHATLARLEAFQQRLDEQDATLRRVLALLIDYVERDAAPDRRPLPGRRMSAV